MGKTQVIGNSGEQFVADYLSKKGYIISARNYYSKFGEIDIIAENNKEILFVEVKTRSRGSYGSPKDYVDKRKQHKIYMTANIYLSRNAVCLQPRLDVAEVFIGDNGEMTLNYIENAFGAEAGDFCF